MGEDKKVPAGRLSRVARLALLGARTGAGWVMDRHGDGAAAHAAEVLGSMRGLAAKMGQMASYVDGLVPDGKRDAFETALSTLRDAAASSPPEAVRALVEEELGAPLDELFDEWDEAPIASASIGQVHRARMPDGREVAVKVQHPGIDRAIENDLQNATLMGSLKSSLLGGRVETERLLEEAKQTLRDELDYRLEARSQRSFIRLHADEPRIRIPAVIDERSSRKVLTTALASGARFAEACEAAPSDRRAWAEVMWRFVFRSLLVGGRFNADPHPGNFFFHDGGAVTALDFGCVVDVPARMRPLARRVHASALARDEAAFREASKQMMMTDGGELEAFVVGYVRRLFDPLFSSPYHIGRDFTTALVRDAVANVSTAVKARSDHFVPFPEGMLFMNRLQFGFYSLLARLDVDADYAGVERRFLDEPWQLAATP